MSHTLHILICLTYEATDLEAGNDLSYVFMGNTLYTGNLIYMKKVVTKLCDWYGLPVSTVRTLQHIYLPSFRSFTFTYKSKQPIKNPSFFIYIFFFNVFFLSENIHECDSYFFVCLVKVPLLQADTVAI